MTPSASFGSVKVFYPRFTRDELIVLLRARTDPGSTGARTGRASSAAR